MKGDSLYAYKGDRAKEEIVNFALRMSSPPVQQITRSESLETVKQANSLLFVYVGEQDGALWVRCSICFFFIIVYIHVCIKRIK